MVGMSDRVDDGFACAFLFHHSGNLMVFHAASKRPAQSFYCPPIKSLLECFFIMTKLSIRPGYLPYALCAAIAMTAGSTLFGNGMIREALFFWALIVPILLATLFDRIEFDGKAITHRGPLPLLLNL